MKPERGYANIVQAYCVDDSKQAVVRALYTYKKTCMFVSTLLCNGIYMRISGSCIHFYVYLLNMVVV